MSLKKVSIVIISVLLIACICVGFAFLLKPAESVGVASALEATLPDTGIVGENLFGDSYYNQFSDSSLWELNYSDCTYAVEDGFLNIKGESASNRYVPLLSFIGEDINYSGREEFKFTIYYRVNSGNVSCTFYDYNLRGGFTNTSLNIMSGDTSVFSIKGPSFVSKNSSGGYFTDFRLAVGVNSGSFDVDIVYIKLERGSSFTGYAIDTNGSYEEGFNAGQSADYQQGYEAGVADGTQSGYDEGYKAGVSDGLISANDIFVCSAVDIEYDKVKDYIYFNPNDVYSSYANVMVNSFAMAFVPLSSLRYDDVDGGFYPVDIVRNSEGELPDVKTSAYYMVFNSLVDVGQWLLDNPNDYLCSYYITGEAEPAAIIFADLSRLDSFMSGASVNYQNGYDDGYGSGFASGENTGYNKGYSVGYNKGTVEGSDYSFIGLIGSVLDAPISAFKGLLNFDILGVNMASFVTAILSLCVVIVVVKICMR